MLRNHRRSDVASSARSSWGRQRFGAFNRGRRCSNARWNSFTLRELRALPRQEDRAHPPQTPEAARDGCRYRRPCRAHRRAQKGGVSRTEPADIGQGGEAASQLATQTSRLVNSPVTRDERRTPRSVAAFSSQPFAPSARQPQAAVPMCRPVGTARLRPGRNGRARELRARRETKRGETSGSPRSRRQASSVSSSNAASSSMPSSSSS